MKKYHIIIQGNKEFETCGVVQAESFTIASVLAHQMLVIKQSLNPEQLRITQITEL